MSRSQKITLASLMFVVFCFGFVVDAQADTIIFQPTRASFNAASPSQTTLTFEGIAPAGGATSSSSSRTVGGVTFSNTFGGSPSSSVQIYDAGYSSGEYWLNSGATLVSPVGSFNSGSLQFVTTITLPTGGATAIGMDLGYGTIAPITVTAFQRHTANSSADRAGRQ